MNLHNAEFVRSVTAVADCPKDDLPQIAFAGKSNVGKSSVINKLLLRKNFARVGEAPGKTTHINFFRIDEAMYLVDLPGYGFAKVSKEEKLSWGKMMQNYFAQTEDLCHVFHLVDIRHEPTQEDREMNLFLRQAGIPFSVVATKADKISRGARLKYIAPICRALAVQPWQVIPFSAEDGTGREALLERIEQVCYTVEEEGDAELARRDGEDIPPR